MSSPNARGRKSPRLPRKRPGPAGGKRDRNRRETVQTLHDAALRLFLAGGIEGVTIDEIVAAAGIAKGSFYRSAADKADLVSQIMTPVGDEVIAALDRCEQGLRVARADTLAGIYVQLASDLSVVVARQARLVLLYLQEARSPASPARRSIHAIAEQLTTRAVALTQTARAHGLIRDVDPEVSALTVLGAIDTILFEHLRQRRLPASRGASVINELVTIVLRGILARP
ncbi:MAG: TetR/AcrR family transcriptional regulator [Myxococcales bacterium]|nr:TetR/AcrR family transcriptional regulator [Myxococcales bacterium]